MFFHEHELMKLEIAYASQLDNADKEGFWDVDNNHVALSWRLFKEFRSADNYVQRKQILDSLTKISQYQLA